MDQSKIDFKNYVLEDLLKDVPGISSKAMFGAYGLYLEGIMFGAIIDNEVYFRADEMTKKKYESRGGKQFIYKGHKKGKPVGMPWWRVPAEILEDINKISEWLYEAFEITKKAKK